jgi:plasmid maintenance system antidote protein VapI
MAVRIQFRRGTAAEWAAANPTLAPGELGYESDTGSFKIGNGTTAWASLAYGAVGEAYVDNAIANVVGLSPETLDTLEELAAAVGNNPNFVQTVTDMVADAEANVVAYTDNAVSALVNAAPQTLNTLSELSAALNNDENFYLTLQNSINGVNTYAVAYTDNAIIQVTDVFNTSLTFYATTTQLTTEVGEHAQSTANVHGISDTANLAYVSDVANEVTAHNTTINVHGISDTANLAYLQDILDAVAAHNNDTTSVHGILDTANLATTASVTQVATSLSDHETLTTNVHGIADTADLVDVNNIGTVIAPTLALYATLDSPEFSGTVVLPATTSIGPVSGTELGYLDNVASNIQDQLDAKLATASAASIYAPIANAALTGNVSLPATTTIGDVSATEIGYLNNVSSSIQTQIDAKAPIESPTFTGTVSGITAAMVGLGDVDNTSDLDKPVSNAVQTALDLKANLASPVFTGEVETSDLTVTGNLIVQGTTTTVSASDLKLRDNMIYMNQAGSSVITNAVGDGTNVVYTTSEAHGYAAGDFVTVANVVPTSFNISGDGEEILAVTSNTFTVASTVTDTYTSGGTARGKVHFNPDLGWAAGRYADNTYAHAGMFRDATDGRFKFFDNYTPEPDESVFIDTSHASFALAPIQVQNVITTGVTTNSVAFSDGTEQTTAGVPSITQFSTLTGDYTLDSISKKDGVYEVNSSTPVTITIPSNATLAWPIGASVDFLQVGTGQVTISPAAGVTLNYTPGNKLRTQWSSCTIMKRGTDSWVLYGDLTA